MGFMVDSRIVWQGFARRAVTQVTAPKDEAVERIKALWDPRGGDSKAVGYLL
jgi:hypothetical protein